MIVEDKHGQSMLETSDIRTDGGTQSRAKIDGSVVAEYLQAYRSKASTMPPVVVFHDGNNYWLADGFHRVRAVAQTSQKRIAADVRLGSQRDAILFSVGANAGHGLRRTNADKRRAVTLLLNDGEWGVRSDRWIADQCGVSAPLVGDVRATVNGLQLKDKRTGKDGKTRKPRKRPSAKASNTSPTSAYPANVGAALEAGMINDEQAKVLAKRSELEQHRALKRMKDGATPEDAMGSDETPALSHYQKSAKGREMAAFDKQVEALLDDKFAVYEIAKELGCKAHKVQGANRRLGRNKPPRTNPLQGILEHVQSFTDTWALVKDENKGLWKQATRGQLHELNNALDDLTRAQGTLKRRTGSAIKERES